LKKGKLKKIESSTGDKPGVRPAGRIWKSEVDRFLDGGDTEVVDSTHQKDNEFN